MQWAAVNGFYHIEKLKNKKFKKIEKFIKKINYCHVVTAAIYSYPFYYDNSHRLAGVFGSQSSIHKCSRV
jgi:uncharacterized protein YjlB